MRESIGRAGMFFMINDAATQLQFNWMNKKRGLVKCTQDYCKWRIVANYDINRRNEMTIGPFPGKLGDASFMAFDYLALDVLCLEMLVLQDKEGQIDILEVRFDKQFLDTCSMTTFNAILIYRRLLFNMNSIIHEKRHECNMQNLNFCISDHLKRKNNIQVQKYPLVSPSCTHLFYDLNER